MGDWAAPGAQLSWGKALPAMQGALQKEILFIKLFSLHSVPAKATDFPCFGNGAALLPVLARLPAVPAVLEGGCQGGGIFWLPPAAPGIRSLELAAAIGDSLEAASHGCRGWKHAGLQGLCNHTRWRPIF